MCFGSGCDLPFHLRLAVRFLYLKKANFYVVGAIGAISLFVEMPIV